MELTKLGLSEDSANHKSEENSPNSSQYYVPAKRKTDKRCWCPCSTSK